MLGIQWFAQNIWWITLGAAAAAASGAVALHALLRPAPGALAAASLPAPAEGGRFSPESFLIGALLLGSIAVSVYAEDFAFTDSEAFHGPLRGGPQHYPPPVWPSIGRFFPLTHQEFAPLSRISSSIVFYKAVAAAQLLATCLILASALRLHLRGTALLYAALILSAPVFVVHMGLVFGERNQILLLACLVWGLERYLAGGRPAHLALAAAALVPMLLYKETALIFPAALGGACLLGAGLAAREGRRDEARRLLAASLPLLAAPVAYVGFYALLILPRMEAAYSAGADRAHTLAVLAAQAWAWLLPALVALRLWLLLRGRLPLSPLWDGLLLAGALCIAANVVLRALYPYLHAPAVVAIWCHALFLLRGARLGEGARRALFAALCATALLQLPPTLRDVRAWKEIVAANVSTARFLAHYHALRGGEGQALAVLATDPADAYHLGILANYLNARHGTPVEILFAAAPEGRPPAAPCIGTEPVLCRYGADPAEADVALLFRPGQAAPPGFRPVFASEPVGFWTNALRRQVLERVP